MKKQFLLMAFICLQATILSASFNNICYDNSTRSNYLNRYSPIAVTEMQRSSIPASITLAQGILESAWGKGTLAARSNNHFGIKCKEDWTGATVPYKDDDYVNGKLIKSCFRAYNDPYDSYRDHTDFLVNRERYAALFELHPMDYVGWAKGLKACGYATAPDYAERLIRIIEENKLYLYDVNYIKTEEAPIVEQTTIPSEETIHQSMTAIADEENSGEEYLDIVIPSKINTSGKTQAVYTEIYTTNYTPEIPIETVAEPVIEAVNIIQIAQPVIERPTVTRSSDYQTQIFAAPTFNIDLFLQGQYSINTKMHLQTKSMPSQREKPSQMPTTPNFVPTERLMNIPQQKDRTQQSKRSISLINKKLR